MFINAHGGVDYKGDRFYKIDNDETREFELCSDNNFGGNYYYRPIVEANSGVASSYDYDGTTLKMYFDNLQFLFLKTCNSINRNTGVGYDALDKLRIKCRSAFDVWRTTYHRYYFHLSTQIVKPNSNLSMILGFDGLTYELDDYLGLRIDQYHQSDGNIKPTENIGGYEISKSVMLVEYLFKDKKSIPDSWYLSNRIYSPDDWYCLGLNTSHECDLYFQSNQGFAGIETQTIGILTSYVLKQENYGSFSIEDPYNNLLYLTVKCSQDGCITNKMKKNEIVKLEKKLFIKAENIIEKLNLHDFHIASIKYTIKNLKNKFNTDKPLDTIETQYISGVKYIYTLTLGGIPVGGEGSRVEIEISPSGKLMGIEISKFNFSKISIKKDENHISELLEIRKTIYEHLKNKFIDSENLKLNVKFAYMLDITNKLTLSFLVYFNNDKTAPIKILIIPYSDIENYENYLKDLK